MEQNLKFIDTLTVEQFKKGTGVEKIQVKRNPKTNKLFFQFGGRVGAVAAKGIPQHPMISRVETPEGDQFYLLHEEAQGGAPVVATF